MTKEIENASGLLYRVWSFTSKKEFRVFILWIVSTWLSKFRSSV